MKMNEEFKKALESLKSYYDSGGKYSDLTFHESGMLLNYITNLQEKYQKLKIENAILEVERDVFKNKCDNLTNVAKVIFTGKNYNDLVKENQKLVKVIEEFEEWLGSADCIDWKMALNKLTELKGDSNEKVESEE